MTTKSKNKRPVIVATVGVVGSGKSSVAKYLAGLTGASVINENDIRVMLRAKGQNYDLVDSIADRVALNVLRRGRGVVFDGDLVSVKNQKRLRNLSKKARVKFFNLRAFCDRDIMIGRLLNATYSTKSFFGGASSEWHGKNKGVVVALREMWRRTPHHYKWSKIGGGKWEPRKLPIKFLAEIDTGKNWQKKVRIVAKKLQ